MAQFTATFKVPLPTPIIIKSDKTPRTYSITIEEFNIDMTIAPDGSGRLKKGKERLWTTTCHVFSIAVSRDEQESPPEINIQPNGTHDVSVRAPYFTKRLPAYRRVACQTMNNAISYFKYELKQPLLKPFEEGSQCFNNPEWRDDKGNLINPGIFMSNATSRLGQRGEFGVIKLEGKHRKNLQAALAKQKQVKVHQEILSDAQASAFEGNIRRAVLELAIACEVFVKHTYFGSTDNAAQVFAALEDNRKINVRVLDLIDIGGVSVGRGKFKSFDKGAYNDIDYLFQARNKVAHRGEPIFRDEKGKLHTVDMKLLNKWWGSVQTFFSWAG
jgi:hypothetical protein